MPGRAAVADRPVPALSVALPADQPATIRGVLKHLAGQTIAGSIEIVVATPSPAAFEGLRSDPGGLHSVNVVEIADLSSLGAARARAVQAAEAACVFLGETHSFACAPNWAERLVTRHREGWQVVVPGLRNANPSSILSWAGFLLDYCGWAENLPAGEVAYWPLNNACCDRAALLRVAGGDLAHALSYGDQLILALAATGGRACLEPQAVLSHLNIAHWRPWLVERWVGGHLVSWHRSRDWPLAKRLGYACAFPLIAIVLLYRVWRPSWRTPRLRKLSLALLPLLLLGVAARALGELAGYARLGDLVASERIMTEYELHKARYA